MVAELARYFNKYWVVSDLGSRDGWKISWIFYYRYHVFELDCKYLVQVPFIWKIDP